MPRRLGPLPVSLICTALALAFGWISYSAALTKSAILDEPVHVAGAYADVFLHDHRIDTENPPLWKYWAMLPISRSALRFDPADPLWQRSTEWEPALKWATRSLYQTPNVNGAAIVNTVRGMMLLLAMVLCGVTAWWAYRLAGPVAAIAASVLFCFDPTLLANASIVKNDIAMTLVLLLLVIALWRAIQKLTILNTLGIALACAAAVNIKFSGILYPLIASILLALRALWPRPWLCFGRALSRTWQRTIALIVVTLTIASICTIGIWATYGFRHGVSPDSSIEMPIALRVQKVAEQQSLKTGKPIPPDWKPPPFVQLAAWADTHHLLPQAWLAGFIGTYQAALVHQNYLLGNIRETGWWYYFPLAVLFKEPLATLASLVFVAIVVLVSRLRRMLTLDFPQRVAFLCVVIVTTIYLVTAASQNINHGVRHLLPLFPLVFVAIAVVFARCVAAFRKPSLLIGILLAAGLATETLAAFPNYISFFNIASGGSRGGLRLLGDSNLDWGQDLPLLAQWQQQHPREKLYLCYDDAADPAFYGIHYINLPGGFVYGAPAEGVTTPGVIAISATRLQGLYQYPDVRDSNRRLLKWRVREVLGGSIYLFDVPQ